MKLLEAIMVTIGLFLIGKIVAALILDYTEIDVAYFPLAFIVVATLTFSGVVFLNRFIKS